MTTDAAYAVFTTSPVLRRVHGPDYLNVGWRPERGAPAGTDPSAVLVDRLLRWAPEETSTVVDVACGSATAATRVWRRWPAARVVAVDRSAAALPKPGRGAAQPDADRGAAAPPDAAGTPLLVRADATRLPLRDRGADLILCVEAALHFPSRRAFFAEAARVLRPGGRLVLTDLLVDPTLDTWAELVPAANTERTPEEYVASLRAAGLSTVHIADVTVRTWLPYVEALIAAAAEVSPEAGVAMRRNLAARPVHAYIEAVGKR